MKRVHIVIVKMVFTIEFWNERREELRQKIREAQLRNPSRYWLGKENPNMKGNQYRKGKESWNKLPRMFSICENCGKKIEHNIHQKRRFCNHECYYEWKKKNPEINKPISRKNASMSDLAKQKIREFQIKRIEDNKLNGELLTPCVSKYETPLLDNLEKCFGYTILRQHKVAGYFLDGYCPMLRLAIEVDEPHHKYSIEQDNEKQRIIEKEIGCTFLRIKVPIEVTR